MTMNTHSSPGRTTSKINTSIFKTLQTPNVNIMIITRHLAIHEGDSHNNSQLEADEAPYSTVR